MLRLSHVFIQQLRPFHIEEVARGLLVRVLLNLPCQAVGDSLGDEGLAAAWGAIQQNPLGRGELVFPEGLGIEVRELDGVAQGLDLGTESADITVGHIGHFLEDDLLDIRFGESLEGIARAMVEQHMIPDLGPLTLQGLRELHHHRFIRPADDDGAVLVQEVLDVDHLPFHLIASDPNDIVGLVHRQQLPLVELLDRDLRVDVHLKRATIDAHIDGPIRMGLAEGTIAMGGCAELVDLFFEGHDLALGILKSSRKLFVWLIPMAQLFAGLIVYMLLQAF